jgi:hypothetical protein
MDRGLEGQELGILFHFTGKLIRPYPPHPPPPPISPLSRYRYPVRYSLQTSTVSDPEYRYSLILDPVRQVLLNPDP